MFWSEYDRDFFSEAVQNIKWHCIAQINNAIRYSRKGSGNTLLIECTPHIELSRAYTPIPIMMSSLSAQTSNQWAVSGIHYITMFDKLTP